MLMLAEPLGRALESAGVAKKSEGAREGGKKTVYLTPSGKLFDQKKAREYAEVDELVLLCGRYEGIDQRIIDRYVDDEVCVGNYVLSSGELAALVVVDAVSRLLPGVISGESLEEESFCGGLLEYPQWTRPEVYDSIAVPDVLLSGHHERIREWRLREAVKKTLTMRPLLVERGLEENVFGDETKKIINAEKNFRDKCEVII
jgi:tRNA (guanine37-N1)-methyltransferase